MILHEYTLDGHDHLTEAARLSGAEVARRTHLPERNTFYLLKLGSKEQPSARIAETAMVTLDSPLSFVTRPLMIDLVAVREFRAA